MNGNKPLRSISYSFVSNNHCTLCLILGPSDDKSARAEIDQLSTSQLHVQKKGLSTT